MATATVKKELKIVGVTLELSIDEVTLLKRICGNIRSDSTNANSVMVVKLYSTLKEILEEQVGQRPDYSNLFEECPKFC